MKPILLFLLVFVSYAGAKPQCLDTTIFQTDFEKEVFLEFLESGKADPVKLMSCPDYSQGIEKSNTTWINAIISGLDLEKLSKKGQNKQIKDVYKRVQESHLIKYDEKAMFNDLFKTGVYNCVSASALYAILFERLNIPYVIKETPDHVYLVAGAGNDQTLIETTMPEYGVFYYDEKFKKDYLGYLLQNEIISKEEYSSNSTEELFQQYYDVDSTIDLTRLAALQYSNKGAFCYDDSKFEEAAVYLEKAMILYPSNAIKYSYNAALGSAIDGQTSKKEYSGKNYAKYLNNNTRNQQSIQVISDLFKNLSTELMINHPDKKAYVAFYDEFKRCLSGSIDLMTFDQTYYFFNAYYEYAGGNYLNALKNAEQAYKSNPDNIATRQLIQGIGAVYLMVDRYYESYIDSLEYYFGIFPFLIENEIYQKYYTYCYLQVIEHYFVSGDSKSGTEYLEKLNQILTADPSFYVDKSLVENSFNSIASSYLNKGDYSTAIYYLNEGLKFAPQSDNLKERIRQLENYNDGRVYFFNQQAIIPIKEPSKSFEEEFNSCFPNCWQIKSISGDNKDAPANHYHQLKITAKSNKKADYFFRDQDHAGRWAIREENKLLYLVPDKDENDYLVFKIISIDEQTLKLKPYEGDILKDFEIVMEVCK